MRTCIIQPPYSRDLSLSDEYFAYKIDILDKVDDSVDIIVLPEYSDVPCATTNLAETLYYHNKYIDILLKKCIETAKRCNALVFVNALSLEETGYRNTTYAYDRSGNLVGEYFKKHLPPLETDVLKLDRDYTNEFSEPYVIEIEGLRYGFLTCYDFYFYESFANIATKNIDILIGCSLQRSDTHDAIEIICRFLAYNTNAYVIRSSVSFNDGSDICGASMVVSPKGKVLCNMKGDIGMEIVDFDPKDKYYKPAGYGNAPASHYEYIEWGRKPWQYRNAGPGTVPTDDLMKYPRVCAHRGFCTVAPENSMPAYGAAVALGAEEIEFDVWTTTDGVLVSCHDPVLDRVSNGHGNIYEHSYEELLKLDFGAKFNERFKGLKIPTFEEILQKFAGKVIMNIHIKIWDIPSLPLMIEEIVALIRKYDAQKHCYIMLSDDNVAKKIKEYDPEIKICLGWDCNKEPLSMAKRGIALKADKIQLYKPYFNQETVDLAHKHGIVCNVFWSDDPKETKEFLDMGIETILTNDYNVISQIVKEWERENTK